MRSARRRSREDEVKYESALEHCLGKPGAWVDQPWEGDTVVKVGKKIFAFFGLPENGTIGLKCGQDAGEAEGWRLEYPGDVTVMPYLGRYGWNTFKLTGPYDDAELFDAIDASYQAVLDRLPKGSRPEG
jgi:predicted DNA-binding protein (MmcQ/YjbR family)